MEMINMTTVYKGAVEELQKEAARNAAINARRNTERRIISLLLENSSYSQVAKQLKMSESEVRRIMNENL